MKPYTKLFTDKLRLLVSLIFVTHIAHSSAGDITDLRTITASEYRNKNFTLRDSARHPVETLEFFGIKPSMTVVEIWPGGGWYTEILAPFLKSEGKLYAAHFPKNTNIQFFRIYREKFEKKLAANPAIYEKVVLSEMSSKNVSEIAPPHSADLVLTFRNVHNWISSGGEQNAFKSFYNALKPGGILGIVEHRAKPGTSIAQMEKSGYVTEAYVIQLAETAGFKLEAKSEINANPKDSADHPKGVWTLPPTLRLKEVNKEKYLAIGESDRMTLKFVKPKAP